MRDFGSCAGPVSIRLSEHTSIAVGFEVAISRFPTFREHIIKGSAGILFIHDTRAR